MRTIRAITATLQPTSPRDARGGRILPQAVRPWHRGRITGLALNVLWGAHNERTEPRRGARVSELQSIVERAVEAAPTERGTIGLGSIVRVKEDDGAEATYTVVSPAEAAPANGRVSVESPLGKALEGHHAGDEVTVEAP